MVGNVAAELYDAVAPLAYADADHGYALLHYCEAIGRTLEQVDRYVRDDEALGLPGWGILLDVDNAPAEALPWLAQFVGVQLVAGHTTEQTRLRIRETDGFARGTPAAIRGAARQYLTGTKTAEVRERYDADNPGVDSPYHLSVFTYPDETPDPAAVVRALLEQKPAGIVLKHLVVTSVSSYQGVSVYHDDYADLLASFATYGDMTGPGTYDQLKAEAATYDAATGTYDNPMG